MSNRSKGLVVFLCAGIFLIVALRIWGGEVEECQRIAPKYNAKLEVLLWDKTRVDLLNDEYAIEVDWAPKWAEGIGQALYYAQVTGKKPGVILLIKDMQKEMKFVYRLQTVAAKYDIKVWLEKVEEK